MKQWYYARNGEQIGPVIEDDLIVLLRNSEIPPDSLIWSEGMPEWASAKDVELIYAPPAEEFHNRESPPPDNLTRSSISKESHHAESATHDLSDTSVPKEEDVVYGGIGRGAYFGWAMLTGILSGILGVGSSFLVFIPVLILGGMRYRNIGYNPWLILLVFIPMAGLVVGYQCLALPPGYAQTKRSDRAMKIVRWIYIFFILMVVLAVIITLLDY